MKWMIPLLVALGIPASPAAAADCGVIARQELARMPTNERVGQLLMAGGSLGEDTRRAVRESHAGMAGLPAMPDLKSAAEYTKSLGNKVLVGGDFEYGAIQRIGGTTAYPRGMGLGATRDLAHAAAAATGTAAELKQAGVLMTIGPVADVNSNLQLPFGVRSFGENPVLVSAMTSAQIRAYRSAGVAATVKHFPGHGGASADSHLQLPTVDADRATLERVHFPPFRAAIAARTPIVMTAHVVLKAVDPNLPSTLSSKVITGILRGEMGFDGVVVTDSIQMGAIRDNWGIGPAAVLAVQAGADVVLSTGPYSDHETVLNALRAGVSLQRIDQSATRVLKLKCEYNGRGPSTPKPPDRMARDSITLLDNRSHALPFNPNVKTMVAGVLDVEPLAKAMNATWWQAPSQDPTDAEIADAVSKAPDQVLVATYSRVATLPAGQAKLVKALQATGKRVAAVSIGVPYDVNAYPDLGASLASYAQTHVWGPLPPANQTVMNAVAKVVYGAQPGGKLPVTVSERYPYGHGLKY